MGEAKRRKEILKEQYGKEPLMAPWFPLTKSQAQKYVSWANRGAWIGIGLLVFTWVSVRLIGPALGLWQVN